MELGADILIFPVEMPCSADKNLPASVNNYLK